MAVIKEYMNGNCKIVIHDDSIKGPEEVQAIIDRVSLLVLREEFRRTVERKQSENKGGSSIPFNDDSSSING